MSDLFRVDEPGLFTTIQDLGRPHAVASGVPQGGAMDRFAHRAANLLVGNEAGAATLECTVRGPRLLALADCVIAVTGAEVELLINGNQAPQWTALALHEGDRLGFGKRVAGARLYLAAQGGIAGERWLGSLSTSLLAQRGGMHGRPLAAGDVVARASDPDPDAKGGITGRAVPVGGRPPYRDHRLHVVAGPHRDRLTESSRYAFYTQTFAVAPDSDRMGYRLDGPRLEAPGDELLSFGLVAGAIQLPAGGRPILLMADHATAGGYPIIGVVAGASMPVAAQLLPGDELTFFDTDLQTALKLRADQRAGLASIS